jgi:hypothetical protein
MPGFYVQEEEMELNRTFEYIDLGRVHTNVDFVI